MFFVSFGNETYVTLYMYYYYEHNHLHLIPSVSPCTTKYQTLWSYVLQQKLCVKNTNSLCSRSPLSSILNAMIPLCEPASAQKTGLVHNVWYLVVQCDYVYNLPTEPGDDVWVTDITDRINYALRKFGKCKQGDAVVVVTGSEKGAGYTNTLRTIFYNPGVQRC